MKGFALALALCLAAAPAHAALEPQTAAETRRVPAAPTRWVTDETGFLSPAARERLDRRLEAYERATGHQVVVWIGRTTGGQPLEEWAARTFEAWKIGRKGADDGVALFVLADDRQVRIEVGYGLEGQLTDARASRIIRDELVPRLQRQDRDGAVTAAVDGILAVLGGETGAPAARPAAEPRDVPWGRVVIIAIIVLLGLGLLARNPSLAAYLLWTLAASSRHGGRGSSFGGGGFSGGGGGFGGGGFSGGGGRSGGGGASGRW